MLGVGRQGGRARGKRTVEGVSTAGTVMYEHRKRKLIGARRVCCGSSRGTYNERGGRFCATFHFWQPPACAGCTIATPIDVYTSMNRRRYSVRKPAVDRATPFLDPASVEGGFLFFEGA